MKSKSSLVALGKKIKAIRITKNIQQSTLAEKCKKDKSSMSKIEAGKVNVSFLTLTKISKALGVKIGELFE